MNHVEPAPADHRAFPLRGEGGPLSELPEGLCGEIPGLRDWLPQLLARGGAQRRVLSGEGGARRLATALVVGDGGARRYLLLSLRDLPAAGDAAGWLEAERLDAAARAGGAVSHSLNNALTALLGHADELTAMAALPPAARASAEMILAASERLERLGRRLSRLSAAVRPPEGVSEPAAVLRALVERRRGGLPPGIRIDLGLGTGLGTLLVDPGLLEAVLGEAVTNSATALAGQGRIRITATRAPGAGWPGFDWLALSVRDDGPGFPAACLSGAGRDVLRATSRQSGGVDNALGLPILRGFAAALGGHLALDNPPEGGGRLVLTLPVLSEMNGVDGAWSAGDFPTK